MTLLAGKVVLVTGASLDTFGGLHAVINPAGILRDKMFHKMFHKMDDADWSAVIDVHLNGSYNVARAAINHFRDQQDGALVFFGSTSGLIGNLGQANYAAAKMGIAGLSRIIAMEGAQRPLRGMARLEGWTPQSVVDHALPALAGSFEDLGATNSVFTWEPV